ncbi:hypothetical protein ACIPY3_04495 [Paenarthrobacter sp. NPDC089714]|uniref:hypothetical protein n=1 Tax=Paenarthrobacter sp. NPDC089714 TaxID=3364377 RepID=UPI0037F8FE28
MPNDRSPIHPLDTVGALPLDPGAVARVGVTQAALDAVKDYRPFAHAAATARGHTRDELMAAAGRLARSSAVAHARRHAAFVLPTAADARVCHSAASPF